jgi:transcriptional regulator with XRE-family HTH domain
LSRRYTKEKLSIIVRKNIKKYRLMRKYTLQELADLTGLTHGYVRDLECLTIDKTPLLETIGKFADALEIDIRQLFDDTEELDNTCKK